MHQNQDIKLSIHQIICMLRNPTCIFPITSFKNHNKSSKHLNSPQNIQFREMNPEDKETGAQCSDDIT